MREPIFPRKYIEIKGLPYGWKAATFPTTLNGEVIRFYLGEDEVVNVSRNGVVVRYVMLRTQDAFQDLVSVLETAQRIARGMQREGNSGLMFEGF